jgi:hypothetical protein
MSQNVRQILKAAAEDSELLRQLRDDPKAVAQQFQLSDAERERLERSDLLIASAVNPLAETLGNTTTTGPITITAQTPATLPRTLEELSHERLIEVTQRILIDPNYAAQVRAFLGL